MRLLGNILWYIPFLGFLNALFMFLLGSLLVLLIIPAPIGLGLLQYSKFLLAPFSYSMVAKSDMGVESNPVWSAYSFVIMLFYLPIGVFFTICNIVQIIGLCLSIVGIPVALVLAKSLGTYLNPVGKMCVPVDVAAYAQERRIEQQAKEYFRK